MWWRKLLLSCRKGSPRSWNYLGVCIKLAYVWLYSVLMALPASLFIFAKPMPIVYYLWQEPCCEWLLACLHQVVQSKAFELWFFPSILFPPTSDSLYVLCLWLSTKILYLLSPLSPLAVGVRKTVQDLSIARLEKKFPFVCFPDLSPQGLDWSSWIGIA